MEYRSTCPTIMVAATIVWEPRIMILREAAIHSPVRRAILRRGLPLEKAAFIPKVSKNKVVFNRAATVI